MVSMPWLENMVKTVCKPATLRCVHTCACTLRARGWVHVYVCLCVCGVGVLYVCYMYMCVWLQESSE